MTNKSFNLPEGWIESRLDQVTIIEMGQSPPGHATNDKGEGLPLVGGASDIGDLNPTPSRHTTAPTKICKVDDLILCIRATIGKVCFADNIYCLGRGVAGLRPVLIGKGWILHFLKLSEQKLTSLGTGTTFKQIDKKTLSSFEIPIPPLNEQCRIITKIESLQSRSSKAKKALGTIPPLLEKFRLSVLSSAFRGDLTADWRAQNPDVEPAEKLLERIRKERRKRWEEDELAKMKAKGKTPKDDKWKAKYKEPEPVDTTALPELPEGWCWATLSELSSAVNPIGYGVLQPGNEVEDGTRLVRVCDLEDGRVLTEQLRTISPEVDNQYSRTRLKGGEVLVTVVGTIGRIAIAPNEIAGANVARAVARLTPTDPISASWLLKMLSSSFLNDWLVKGAREVARKTLNIGVLEKTPIPLCSIDEMRECLKKVDKLLSCLSPLRKIAQENLNHISSLDQSILAKAFRGELVPQDPNDEPASQLLERIKQEKKSLKAETKRKGKAGQKKATRKKEATAMAKKKERRPLVEVLEQHTSGLSPEELFSQAGFDEYSVDEFYVELKKEVVSGNIIEDRPDQERVILRLNAA